jgi:hypothetical protein
VLCAPGAAAAGSIGAVPAAVVGNAATGAPLRVFLGSQPALGQTVFVRCTALGKGVGVEPESVSQFSLSFFFFFFFFFLWFFFFLVFFFFFLLPSHLSPSRSHLLPSLRMQRNK